MPSGSQSDRPYVLQRSSLSYTGSGTVCRLGHRVAKGCMEPSSHSYKHPAELALPRTIAVDALLR